jgi:aminomethyltransferase
MTPTMSPARGAGSAWEAAHGAAILIDRSSLGRLSITGGDALDLLHRLSTNDLKELRAGEGAATVFTTAKGRIVDLVLLHRLEDRLLGLTGEGRAGPLAAWIGRYTFREEIRIEDWGATHGTLGIYGARAAECVARLLGGAAARLPLHAAIPVAVAGTTGILTRTFPLGGDGFHLVAAAPAVPVLRQALLDSDPGLVAAGPGDLDPLRIEAGLPAAGRELTEEYNPWEARLDDAISLNKGCYIGQEVVARLHTYKKVARLLVRLGIESGTAPAVPADLRAGGLPAGRLTSAAGVPGEKRVIGLGYVRDEDAVAGRVVEVITPAGPLAATVLGAAR